MAPGSTVTSAAAISVEILKVVESTTFADPPDNCVAATFENEYVYGSDDAPCGLVGACALSAGGAVPANQLESMTKKKEEDEKTYCSGKYRARRQEYGRRRIYSFGSSSQSHLSGRVRANPLTG